MEQRRLADGPSGSRTRKLPPRSRRNRPKVLVYVLVLSGGEAAVLDDRPDEILAKDEIHPVDLLLLAEISLIDKRGQRWRDDVPPVRVLFHEGLFVAGTENPWGRMLILTSFNQRPNTQVILLDLQSLVPRQAATPPTTGASEVSRPSRAPVTRRTPSIIRKPTYTCAPRANGPSARTSGATVPLLLGHEGDEAPNDKRRCDEPNNETGASCRDSHLHALGRRWTERYAWGGDPGITEGRDPKTGEVKRTRKSDLTVIGRMGHARCHRAKGTSRYLIVGRRGIDMVDIESGKMTANFWVRGICAFGFLPGEVRMVQ